MLCGSVEWVRKRKIGIRFKMKHCNQYHHVYFCFVSGMCIECSVQNATMSQSLVIFIVLVYFEKVFLSNFCYFFPLLTSRSHGFSFRVKFSSLMFDCTIHWLTWHGALVGLCLFVQTVLFVDNNLCDWR